VKGDRRGVSVLGWRPEDRRALLLPREARCRGDPNERPQGLGVSDGRSTSTGGPRRRRHDRTMGLHRDLGPGSAHADDPYGARAALGSDRAAEPGKVGLLTTSTGARHRPYRSPLNRPPICVRVQTGPRDRPRRESMPVHVGRRRDKPRAARKAPPRRGREATTRGSTPSRPSAPLASA